MVFSSEILEERPGFLLIRFSGENAFNLFSREGGGHRWQRVPDNDRHGRRHTSTVTVAILSEPRAIDVVLDYKDLVIKTTCSGGPGGQNVNKRETAVQIKHIPSGITVRAETQRSQGQNKELALALLRARLQMKTIEEEGDNRNANRKRQLGSGMRGDKVRTIQVHNARVTDHRNGKVIQYKDFEKGDLSGLF